MAEENVLYPALAMDDMKKQADRLYDEHAQAKILLSALHMASMTGGQSLQDWQGTAKKLRAAILEHAKEHEEENLFPKLQQKVGGKQNELLTASYEQQFGSVKQA